MLMHALMEQDVSFSSHLLSKLSRTHVKVVLVIDDLVFESFTMVYKTFFLSN